MVASSTTSAALCTITASKEVLERDSVLHLILKKAQLQTHQVTVKTPKKGALSLTLAGGSVLEQRNAILRSICGAALHGALDTVGGWSGGLLAAVSSPHCTSQQAVSNYKSLSYWMGVATNISSDECFAAILAEMERTLEQSAFLIPYSATCTLADLDVAAALLASNVDTPPAVSRWMNIVCAVLKQLSEETGVEVPNLNQHKLLVPSLPLFFDGTDPVDELLDTLHKSNQPKDSKDSQKKNVGKQAKKNEKKAPEEPKKKATKQQGGGGDQPTADFDISALDIRVGKITKAWAHESADKLFCEEIDLGTETRQIASGLRPFYKESDLQDRLVLVLCNLKKRNLVGFGSHGMVLCASNADHTLVEFVVPPEGTKIGERVTFEGINPDQAPEPENKVGKKKIFEKLAPDLKTNGAGHVVWKTHVAQTSAGIVQALNGMVDASVS